MNDPRKQQVTNEVIAEMTAECEANFRKVVRAHICAIGNAQKNVEQAQAELTKMKEAFAALEYTAPDIAKVLA